MLQCPFCQSYIHKVCWAIWAKRSSIGASHIFRCHACYNLVKLDKEIIQKVNAIKTPNIEMFDMEDVLFEEYLESLEPEEGPKIIHTEDVLAVSVEESDSLIADDFSFEIQWDDEDTFEEEFDKVFDEEFKAVADEELRIIWCPECNKITTNEYKKCPNCDADISGL